MFTMDTLLLALLPLGVPLFTTTYGQTTNATCRPEFEWVRSDLEHSVC